MVQEQIHRDFKGVWIPKEIWLDPNLNITERVFLTEIDSLDGEKGCFASNKHFAKFSGLSGGRCSQIINGLAKKNYIKITYVREGKEIKQRIIKVFRNLKGGIKVPKGGYLENAKESNTSFSNTSLDKQERETRTENAFSAFSKTNATLNGFTRPQLVEAIDRFGDDVVTYAINQMAEQATYPSFSFLNKKLNDYEDSGVKSVADAEAFEKKRAENLEKKPQRSTKPKHHSIKDTWDKEHERKEKLKQEYLNKYGKVPVNIDDLMDLPNREPIFEDPMLEEDLPW